MLCLHSKLDLRPLNIHLSNPHNALFSGVFMGTTSVFAGQHCTVTLVTRGQISTMKNICLDVYTLVNFSIREMYL